MAVHRRPFLGLLAASMLCAQTPDLHTKRPVSLLIRNAMVFEGVGTPASGPRDILIENNRIARILPSGERPPQAASTIDATGKYVLPGLVNLHGHIQDERGGVPMEVDFCLKLWLASGITAVRDVGSAFEKSKLLRQQSAEGAIAAPRLFLYPFFSARTPAEAVQQVRDHKQNGADGMKHLGTHRDVMEAMRAEATKVGLRTAHHAGVEETNAWDDIRLGTTSIEHWYGIPDAALVGEVQNFPPTFNYQNELDRFRYAGRLWREADPKKLTRVLEAMVKANVAWDPTLNIYEASRDLQRAQNQPWFGDLLHPALEQFFRPNLKSHGSFFLNWTTADEIYWRENYRIWMAALREFSQLGGLIGTGEDAGFIYQIQGFGLIRELELHQEAGFHPLTVLKHATHNGARVLGKENEFGRVRAGWLADLIIVNGNPLENFKILYPTTGGIEWTIKDGILYHAPTLLADVKRLVAKARRPKP